ncbi:MAG: polymer-forming cytoskeletal protein [Clostridiales bacterium]|nr:polymer-forming cytoskeletal protein [Clostridiales bacterium]MCF8023343.1 polymer-forming cytoskeletal protein [Clostridiales bacterium]
MFDKKKNKPNEKVDTIIGNGTSFSGKLNVEGSLRIDGKFDGEINSNGNIVIGKTGYVEAVVRGYNASVAGELYGNICLEGKLEINNTGKIYGDIDVSKLVISEGAVFQGESKMHEKGKQESKKVLSQPAQPETSAQDKKKKDT